MVFSNNEKYSGNFKNDLPNGEGIFSKEDGTTFTGRWKDGKIFI